MSLVQTLAAAACDDSADQTVRPPAAVRPSVRRHNQLFVNRHRLQRAPWRPPRKTRRSRDDGRSHPVQMHFVFPVKHICLNPLKKIKNAFIYPTLGTFA